MHVCLAWTVAVTPINSTIIIISKRVSIYDRGINLSPILPGHYSVKVEANSVLGSSVWSVPKNITVGKFLFAFWFCRILYEFIFAKALTWPGVV